MALTGELADFGRFYERTYQRAFGVAYGLIHERGLAEDVTQDAYVSAYRDRSRYRGEGPVEAWLYRIVVNTALSALRKRRVRAIEPLEMMSAEPPTPGDASTHLVNQLTLAAGLQRLDARARAAVVLRYYLDLDYGTIAAILGTSVGNVGAILSRSLGRLRGDLASELPSRPRPMATERVPGHG